MINRVILIGRLTRDPELRSTTSGKSVANFSIAVDRHGKDDDADFFRVTAWGKTADFVSNYLDKGRLVAIDGRLQSRKFQDKDGNNRETVEVVADSVQSLDYKDRDQQDQRPAKAAKQDEDYDPFAE